MNGKGESAMDEREGSTRAVGLLPTGWVGGNHAPRKVPDLWELELTQM